MNLLGKILTVLILLSSIVFMTLAIIIGATHQNWKAKAEEFKQIAEERTKEKESILASSGEIEKELRAERVARSRIVSQAYAQLAAAETTLESKEDALNELEKRTTVQDTQISQAQAEIKRLDSQIAELKDKNAKLIDQIASIRVQVVDQRNRIGALTGTKQDLEVRQKSLAAQNARLTKVLIGHGLTPTSLVDDQPPKVEGQVSEVGAEGYFMVTLGNDDGLNTKHRLKVSRNGDYIGDAEIISVKNNSLLARMIKELKQDELKEGDYVTTQG